MMLGFESNEPPGLITCGHSPPLQLVTRENGGAKVNQLTLTPTPQQNHQLNMSQGPVPPQLYPDDAHYLPPHPLWIAEQRQAAMEADRIASLQTPQPCGFWPQPQTNAFPNTPQSSLCSTAGDIGTPTASSPYDPQYHRTVVGLLGTPPIMQPQSSSPTSSNWGFASGSEHQNLTATQMCDSQPTEYFYRTLPSDQGLVRNNRAPLS